MTSSQRLIFIAVFLLLLIPAKSFAQKADGYAFQQNEKFSPGMYEAIRDAKVYFDVDNKAINKKLVIKKGTKISVYSAGHHGAKPPSDDWFDLGEGQECNGNILPWKDLGWVGVQKKDFKRITDLLKPVLNKGIITNCISPGSVNASASAQANTGPIMVINAVPDNTPSKDVRCELG